NHHSRTSFSLEETWAVICKRTGNKKMELVLFKKAGGAFINHTAKPAARTSQMFSVSVKNVTMVNTINMIHSNQSFPMVFLISLKLLTAMMPMTAAPTP